MINVGLGRRANRPVLIAGIVQYKLTLLDKSHLSY
jgi:hypothetical protein